MVTATRRRKRTAAPELGRMKALGIERVSDLLLTVPKRYEDYTKIERVIPLPDEKRHVFMLKVVKKDFISGSKVRLNIELSDSQGKPIQITIWGNYFDWKEVLPGSIIFVEGVLMEYKGEATLKNPRQVPPKHLRRIVPIYQGIKGKVAAATIEERIATIFDEHKFNALATISNATGKKDIDLSKHVGFDSMETWLRALHFPTDVATALKAKEAVAGLAALEIICKAQKIAVRQENQKSVIAIKDNDVAALIAHLPFTLTSDQVNAINEVVVDLRSPIPARRLISGDVGTGKSQAFLIPAIAAHRAGAKVAVMVPMTLLVGNTADEVRAADPTLDVFLHQAGGKILPTHGFVIGTHAIISAAKKAGWVPDLLVIDEQQKLGAEDRNALAEEHTNVIEATATAIPRSQALITHGGLDVSILRESPCEKFIETHILGNSDRKRLFDYVKDVVAKGHQVAFVYPLVTEETENNRKQREAEKRAKQGDLLGVTGAAYQSVESAMEVIERAFPGQTRMLHGRMPAEEKQAVLRSMQNGEFSVLATSSSLELGVTLPKLKVMVLVDPKSMGLSTLHQLRGRLARHGGRGMCFVYSPDVVSDTTMQRYRDFASTTDGFRIAEMDLESRGMGDMDEDAQNQAGVTRTLFHGIKLQANVLSKILQQVTNQAQAIQS